jgi:hypothetical protein
MPGPDQVEHGPGTDRSRRCTVLQLRDQPDGIGCGQGELDGRTGFDQQSTALAAASRVASRSTGMTRIA